MKLRLTRQLALEAPTRSADGAGGFVESWELLGTLWADIQPRSGRETSGTAGPISKVGYKIIVRAAPVRSAQRPKPEQRFREGTRVFRITAVTEHDPEGRFLVAYAEEESGA